MSEQPGRYQRSFPGMVGAMVVLLLVVLAFVVFREVNRADPADPVRPVDYRAPADYARDQARFDLLAPEELPAGWIVTSVRFDDGRRQAWHLGLLTDERRYVGLEQEQRPVEAVVEEYVDEAASRGEDVQLDGVTWQTWADEGGDSALVRRQDGVTTLLVGRVPQATLEEFLATLR